MSDSSNQGIKARRINAHNVVQGIQIQGVAREIIDEVAHSIQKTQEGSIEADDISAYSVVSGLQYLNLADGVTVDEIYTELQTLRKELEALIVSSGFADDRDGQEALRLADDVSTELKASSPDGNRITRSLRLLSDDLSRAVTACDAIGKVSESIAKCALAANTLWHVAQRLFDI